MALFSTRRSETDMTSGRVFSLLLGFALPLLLGNIFQQLYNTVDTWVVGNFVGKQSFSAVGTLSSVTNAIIGFFMGFSSGAGVVISRYYGSHDPESVEKAVHTYVAVTIAFCIIVTVLGILSVPLMIRILNSPQEVAVHQKTYLTIYCAGVSGLLIYNAGAAILRAVGNSVHPFMFLVVTTVLNMGLDLLFVIGFRMGTAGVAFATILAQAISAALVVRLLLTADSQVRVRLDRIRVDRVMLGQIFRIGFPSALQLSITAFSNVFVQRYINFFGTDVMGGWTAYSKIDQLFFLPMQSLALAVTTFVSQNLGAGHVKRARHGSTVCLMMALSATAFLVSVVMLFAPSFVAFFIDDKEENVIYYGSLFLRMNGPFFLLACVNQIYGGVIRAAGRSELAMFNMLFSFVVFRQIYLFVMTRFIINTPQSVGISYPVGWALCSILMFISYLLFFPRPSEDE